MFYLLTYYVNVKHKFNIREMWFYLGKMAAAVVHILTKMHRCLQSKIQQKYSMLFIGSSIYDTAMPRRAWTAEGSHWPAGGSADFINAVQTFKDTEHNHHIDSSAHQKKQTCQPANLYSSERQESRFTATSITP